MSSLFGKFTNKIRNVFGSRPVAPKVKTPQQKLREHFTELKVATGSRGRAYGSLQFPNLSAENVAKWRDLGDVHGTAFVYEAEPLFVHSSNVAQFQYFINSETMLVEFLNGSTYKYDNVTEQEAVSFFVAQSKGGAVWSILRVRGSKTQHKKPYTKVRTGHFVPNYIVDKNNPINRSLHKNEG